MIPGATIGFVVKTYPKISETFILEELLGLERHGLRLHIFSLGQPRDAVSHDASRTVRAPVTYLPSAGVSNAMLGVRAHVALLVKSPWRYLHALWFVLRRAEGGRLRAFFQAGYLTNRLSKAGIRHLHAHFASEPAGVAELVNKLSGISYSISAHAKDIYLSSPASLRRKISAARFTVTCTEYNRKHLAGIAPPDATVLRMYHGIDLDRFQRGHVAERAVGAPLLLSVGRLREKKGFTTLIEACRLLRDAGTVVRCKIVGYGEEHDRLAGLISLHGLEGAVQLTGKMTQDELLGLYRSAAAFALPCQVASDGDRDGIPNVLLEAMAMELAVVSTDVSGIPEVIQNGINGLLVRPGDATALAVAISRVLNDLALRRRLGKAGRHTVATTFCNEENLQTVRQLLLAASCAAGEGNCDAPRERCVSPRDGERARQRLNEAGQDS
jgi:glycosyltransferase involved in cell wall biosynthesis